MLSYQRRKMITNNVKCPHCDSREEEVGFYIDGGENELPIWLICNGCNQAFRNLEYRIKLTEDDMLDIGDKVSLIYNYASYGDAESVREFLDEIKEIIDRHDPPKQTR